MFNLLNSMWVKSLFYLMLSGVIALMSRVGLFVFGLVGWGVIPTFKESFTSKRIYSKAQADAMRADARFEADLIAKLNAVSEAKAKAKADLIAELNAVFEAKAKPKADLIAELNAVFEAKAKAKADLIRELDAINDARSLAYGISESRLISQNLHLQNSSESDSESDLGSVSTQYLYESTSSEGSDLDSESGSDLFISPWQTYFVTPETPVMEGIVEFHDQVMFLITFIVFFVGCLLARCVYLFRFIKKNFRLPERFVHSVSLETLWTVIPGSLLTNTLMPSLSLIYAIDDLSFIESTLKCIGHQWWWGYELFGF
jgi:hypothetical protein